MIVWHYPLSVDITNNFVFENNPGGTITNYNIKISTLILRKATLMSEIPKAVMASPLSGSENTPTVSWSTREVSTIDLVVVDLLRICALHSIQFFLKPSIFLSPSTGKYHGGLGLPPFIYD